MDMQKESLVEERALGFVAFFYYAILLTGFVIGMYGFFSLLWMAGSLVERNSHIAGTLY